MEKNDEIALRLRDYQETFGSTHGKRVLKDMLGNYHFLTSTVGKDNNETNYLEGQRSVIVEIITLLALDESDLLTEVMEHSHFSEMEGNQNEEI